MRRAVRISVATAYVLVVLAWHALPAHACSCAAAPLEVHVQRAALVFVGTAEDSKDAPEGVVTRFRVTTIFKGSASRHVDIRTANNEAACGVPFVEGRSYAVFAGGEGGMLTTNLCAGTTDDVASVAGLIPIAPPASPARRGAPEERAGRSRAAPIALAASLLALISAASVIAVRISRRPRPIV